MSVITNGLTEQEDLQLQQLLKKWKDAGCGVLSDETFTAFAETVPQVGAEVLVFRKNKDTNSIETLVMNRPPDDIIWPGLINFPGKVMRIADFVADGMTPFESVISRIEEKELQNKLISPPIFCNTSVGTSERGPGVVFCYLGELADDAKLPWYASWEDVEKLKKDPKFIKCENIPLDIVLKYYVEHN